MTAFVACSAATVLAVLAVAVAVFKDAMRVGMWATLIWLCSYTGMGVTAILHGESGIGVALLCVAAMYWVWTGWELSH